MSAIRPVTSQAQIEKLKVTTNAQTDGPNTTLGHTTNAIASDISNGVILGAGSTGYNNIIGGDGSATVDTTTPNAVSASTGAHVSVIGGYDNVAGQLSSKIISDHSYTEVGGQGHNAIFGGAKHKILSTAGYSFIAGGVSNIISGLYAFATGNGNTASATGAAVFGQTCVASGTGSVCYGSGSLASGAYSRAHGLANTAEANYSIAEGNYAHARTVGQQTLTGGRIAALGDAQTSVIEMHRATTDATVVTLGVIGSNTSYKLLPNQAVAFSCLIIARDTAGTDAAGWKVEGVATRGASGTPTFPAAVTVTALGASAGASTWAATVAGASDGSLNTRITGEAGKTIRWVQRMTLAEVLGA